MDILDILETLRKFDATSFWFRSFAWTKPKVEVLPEGTLWAFYGRKSAEEPNGLGKIVVKQLKGEKLLNVRMGSSSWWVDIRSPREMYLDDMSETLEKAALRARQVAGAKILDQQRIRRGPYDLIHGDKVVLEGKTFKVSTLEGWALANGMCPKTALADNARKREEGARFQDPDRGNEWFPSWGPEVYLQPVKWESERCPTFWRAEAMVLEPGRQYQIAGGAYVLTEKGFELLGAGK